MKKYLSFYLFFIFCLLYSELSLAGGDETDDLNIHEIVLIHAIEASKKPLIEMTPVELAAFEETKEFIEEKLSYKPRGKSASEKAIEHAQYEGAVIKEREKAITSNPDKGESIMTGEEALKNIVKKTLKDILIDKNIPKVIAGQAAAGLLEAIIPTDIDSSSELSIDQILKQKLVIGKKELERLKAESNISVKKPEQPAAQPQQTTKSNVISPEERPREFDRGGGSGSEPLGGKVGDPVYRPHAGW